MPTTRSPTTTSPTAAVREKIFYRMKGKLRGAGVNCEELAEDAEMDWEGIARWIIDAATENNGENFHPSFTDFTEAGGEFGVGKIRCGSWYWTPVSKYENNIVERSVRRRQLLSSEDFEVVAELSSNNDTVMNMIKETMAHVEDVLAQNTTALVEELELPGISFEVMSVTEEATENPTTEKGNVERLISLMPSTAPIKNTNLTDDQLRDAKDKAKELINTANESVMMKKAKNKSGLGGGAIAGIVISAIIAVECCGVVIFRFLCNKSSSGYKKRRVYYSSSEISSYSSESSSSSSSS